MKNNLCGRLWSREWTWGIPTAARPCEEWIMKLLALDEMKISQGLVYSHSSGNITGFTSLGTTGNELAAFSRKCNKTREPPQMITHVLVLMARAISSSQDPCSVLYHFKCHKWSTLFNCNRGYHVPGRIWVSCHDGQHASTPNNITLALDEMKISQGLVYSHSSEKQTFGITNRWNNEPSE